jgi:hypothetical protein
VGISFATEEYWGEIERGVHDRRIIGLVGRSTIILTTDNINALVRAKPKIQ